MSSMEEKVVDLYKKKLDELGIRYWRKTEEINSEIGAALKSADSKSGGSGGNFPDLQCFLDDGHGRRIPVMLEAKGSKGKMEHLENDGSVSQKVNAVLNYAVNGALHYGKAILSHTTSYNEVIVIGLNGSEAGKSGEIKDLACKAYYVSKNNGYLPKHILELDNDLTLLAPHNLERLYAILDNLLLSETEREQATRKIEESLEKSVQDIHQSLYDGEFKSILGTNEKLYLFSGLIMSGLKTEGVKTLEPADFYGNDDPGDNDGIIILRRIEAFLNKRNCSREKIGMIISLLRPVFTKEALWKPENGESAIKKIYQQVKSQVIPYLESPFHLDFTGKIMNQLNDWVALENDKKNDVVLTPRQTTSFMAKLCRTDMNSHVWDWAMGSGGFLVSAMDLMIRDAKDRIKDSVKLSEKIRNIKQKQLMGVEILGNIFLLAMLNMIMMDDGSSRLIYGDSHEMEENDFAANVFLLNPPYSAPGKGLVFAEEALSRMHDGYGAILIQENAGSGQGGEYPARLLKKNTLVASIRMPLDLFRGKSVANTAIYVFKAGVPHCKDNLVKFIDFSNDGYTRQNRKKCTQEINLKNTDHAIERYAEVVNLVLGRKPETAYYTRENGLYLEDTITLSGNDWTFNQHKKVDITPELKDFKKTVADYLAWRVGESMRAGFSEAEKKTLKIDMANWSWFNLDAILKKIHMPTLPFNINEMPKTPHGRFSIPAIASGGTNQGVACYVPANSSRIKTLQNVISISANGEGYAFWQPGPFTIIQDAYAVNLKDEKQLTTGIALFLVSLIQKILDQHFGWKNKSGWNKLKKYSVQLPVTDDGRPDWTFMEKFISMLENERASELERDATLMLTSYLNAACLDSCVCTEKDLAIISENRPFKMFTLGALFKKEILKWLPKRAMDKKKDVSPIRTPEFDLPLVNAKHGNNGIMFYGRKKEWGAVEKSICVVSNGAVATGDVYPEPDKTGVLWDAYLLTSNGFSVNTQILVFFACVTEYVIKPMFNYDNKAVWSKVKNCKIPLPVRMSNGDPVIDPHCIYHPEGFIPDLEYMEKYIRTIEKLVIKDVVDLRNTYIKHAKRIVKEEVGSMQ